MRRFLLILLLSFTALWVQAQAFNNEWIDYSKPYYKFKVGRSGLYRINQNILPTELRNIPAEQFQLWRNGVEIPVYTSVSSGVLPANGYLEFWGEKNDGKPDKALYKNPANQLSDALSLETDTASYFLTVNATGNNLRIINDVNNVAGNTLPPEPYFMYDYMYNYQQQINPGRAVNFVEYVYSSTYDVGEFWSSHDIAANSILQLTSDSLYLASNANGSNASLQVSIAGNSTLGSDRVIKINLNGNQVINSSSIISMNAGILANNSIKPSVIGNSKVTFTFSESSSQPNDRMVIGFVDLNYPRQFNFGGQSNFEFKLAATTQGNYLEMTNFNSGIAAPVLYDLTNRKRYTANTGVAGLFRFRLPSSNVERELVLVSEDTINIIPVNNLIKRIFIDYSNSANQGDYLIISNQLLGLTGGVVSQYAQYRTQAQGGSYKSLIVDIDELVDQFAFGIKKHPLSVKNFLRFARNRFAVAPKFAFLIGKAVTYNEYRMNESSPNADKLNLVPTFGWPASDNILGSDGFDPIPETPIGRLAAIRPEEVEIYLEKIMQYEKQQQSTTQTIDDKAWMKTILHVTGANDASLDYLITYQNRYRDIIEDTLYGGHVFSFNRIATGPETPATKALMTQLFSNGISFVNYFGHSAVTQFDYDLSTDQLSNNGKYPVFLVSGCFAGNIYSYDTLRFLQITSLSESFVLSKDKGAVGFIASSHLGVVNYLDAYNRGFYESLSHNGYGKPVSTNMRDAITYLLNTGYDSTTRYLHGEENVLHGDPALKINSFAKPDFVVEDSKVIINPTFISVADNSFNVKVYFYNIGKAEGDSVAISIKRQYPDNSISTLVDKQIVSVRFIDSVTLTIPIVASRDIGANALIVSIDDPKKYDELSELNNTVTKRFFIYEDELKPVYPYNFSIVNKPDIKLVTSTANPLSPPRQYIMEIDTTELFNSSFKATQTITSGGGIIEFAPGITFRDSTVYYWRVAPVATNGNNIWNTSSFVYLPGSSFGYNQSHLYQHLKSSGERIYIDSFSRKWLYKPVVSLFKIIHSIYPYYRNSADFQIQINGQTVTANACLGHSVIFNVFDPVTLKPLYNQTIPSTNPSGTYGRFMGSASSCNAGSKSGTQYNFEFYCADTSGRRRIRDFMDWVPDGYLVSARLILDSPYSAVLVDKWKNDQSIYGVGNTAYDRLKNAGFAGFDEFTYPRTWAFVYKKNTSSFSPAYKLSDGLFDQIELSLDISSPDSLGYITSPAFGPAASWKQVKWRGSSLDTKPGDAVSIDVIGVSSTGAENILYTLNAAQQDFDISSVSASAYPYIKLRMRNADSINLSPYQLRYWRLLYVPVPEGALAPNVLYTFKDTLALGEKTNFAIAFKNVSDVPFADSIKVNMVVYDENNVANNLTIPRLKKLNPGDTASIIYSIDSKNFTGKNNLFLDVNPENNQPEQYHFNNFLYRNFTVSTDNYKPILDVTFDGIHILNNDIVSAQPHILVKLKDESKFLLLDDTSLFKIQLQYPDGSLRRFYFNNDTLRFTPAATGAADNTATVDFTPYLLEDGVYQLLIHGQDKTGNPAGNTDYSVSFQTYNKPMISNMFNYPNPFTTSTAFVFTITGSQVPQNIRIQILTITGKIVREITKDELGPLHIGRNITEFKWDGTDQYGQKLANGVYLYHVSTNLNGSKLSKFPTYGTDGNEVNTDQYFNKGYGKMYLMR